MSTLEELRQQMLGLLQKARAICDAADGANRDFSARERKEVADYLAAAGRVKAQIAHLEKDRLTDAERKTRQKASDDAIRQELVKMGVFDPMGPAIGVTGGGLYRGGQASGSWGQAFKQSYRPSSGSKQVIEPTGSVAVPVFSETLPALTGEPAESILQLIPTERLDGTDGFSYLQETLRVHRADVVAAGETKPTSTYTVQRIDDRVRVIAHLSEAIPRQYVADMPLLTRYLDAVLKEGYRLTLEDLILNGSGVGEEFTGIFNTSGLLNQAWDTDILTTTRKALTTLQAVEVTATGWALNPEDWEECELSVDQRGQYQMAAAGQAVPVDLAARRLWSRRVALSNQVPAGQGILADWRMVRLWEREQVNITWTESGYMAPSQYDQEPTDLFKANLMMFRCEGREGFAVLRPVAICIVDLAAGS